MRKVIIKNLESKSIDCKDKKERLLDILLNATDWMHACGGKGRCTTCKAIILKGMDFLSKQSEAEIRFANLGRLKKNERLTCQVRFEDEGVVIVKVPYESKMPHLNYSD